MEKEFLKEIKAVQSADTYTAFFDMLYMAMSEINYWQDKNTASYLGLNTARYQGKDKEHLSNAFAYVMMMMEEHANKRNFYDVLGRLFHVLELHNQDRGQFFTPQHLADLLASLGADIETLKERNVLTVCEPAVGAGANVLGLCNYLMKLGYNPQQVLRVEDCDVDIRCVTMCYLQMTLYGIPAKIIHGDTLRMVENKTFYTPWWMMNRGFH